MLQDSLSTAPDRQRSRRTILCRAGPRTHLPPSESSCSVGGSGVSISRQRFGGRDRRRCRSVMGGGWLVTTTPSSLARPPARHPRSMIDRACFGDRHRCSFLPETTARFVPHSNPEVLASRQGAERVPGPPPYVTAADHRSFQGSAPAVRTVCTGDTSVTTGPLPYGPARRTAPRAVRPLYTSYDPTVHADAGSSSRLPSKARPAPPPPPPPPPLLHLTRQLIALRECVYGSSARQASRALLVFWQGSAEARYVPCRESCQRRGHGQGEAQQGLCAGGGGGGGAERPRTTARRRDHFR